MNLETNRADLLDALTPAAAVADGRMIPLIGCVRLSAAGGAVVVCATDQKIGTRHTVPATVNTPGEIVVDAKRLLAVAKACSSETITLAADERDRLIVTAGSARLTLRTLDPAEYPLPPKSGGDAITLDAATLADTMRRVLPAMSTDESRVALCGVHFACGGGAVTMTATDGHRLATVRRKVDSEGTFMVVLPRKAALAVARMLPDDGSVDVRIAEGVASFDVGRAELWARLIEAEFPDYEQVIPKQPGPSRAVVDVAEMVACLRRVRVVANERSHGVKVSIGEDHVQVMTLNPDVGEATDSVAANVTFNGPAACFGVNADYLIDALEAAGETAQIAATDDVSPVLVTAPGDDGVRALVMVMRL